MKPHNYYWTYERTKIEALKYETKSKFKNGSNGAYHSARLGGFLDEICSHFASINNMLDELFPITPKE